MLALAPYIILKGKVVSLGITPSRIKRAVIERGICHCEASHAVNISAQ